MEHVVNMSYFKKVELIDDGREHHCDDEWTFMFWDEFEIDNKSFEISRFKPDFVSFEEGGEVAMDAGNHDLVGEFVGS